MAAPWEKYQQEQPKQEGPWAKYGQQAQPSPDVPMGDGMTPGSPAPAAPVIERRGTGEELLRQTGLTARSALQGLGGVVGIFSDPLAAAQNVVAPDGAKAMTARDLATLAADKIGLPKPETGLERVVGQAVETGTGGAGLAGGSRQVAGLTKGPVMSALEAMGAGPTMQATSATLGGASAQTAQEAGAGPGGQVVAGLAGAVAPSATAGATRLALRGGEKGRQTVERNLATFERAGTTPSVGQATGRRVPQSIESLAGRTPGGAGRTAQFGQNQQAAIGQRVEEIADSLSRRTGAEEAGRAIVRGIKTDFMPSYRAKSKELYDAVETLLPPGSAVDAAASRATLAKLTAPIAGAERTSGVIQNPRLAAIAKAFEEDVAANGGKMPYASMKRLRTEIGELIGDSVLSPDEPTRQLKLLYGAMSDDMTRAAQLTGDPKVVRAVNRANNFYKAGQGRIERIESVIDRNGGPERVFGAAMSGTRDGATTLRAVMKSLPLDDQKTVAATVLRRMGRANPSQQNDVSEVFSTERFLTNWNTMSPEARKVLFDRLGAGYANDVNKIARAFDVAKASNSVREGSRVFSNPAGTTGAGAQLVANVAGVGGVVTGNTTILSAVAGGVIGANLAARAMTSPAVVRFLARNTDKPVSALAPQLAMLKAEGYSKGDDAAVEFVQALEQQGQQRADENGNR